MEKIKQFLESSSVKRVLVVIIVIFVSLGSFEIGRLSKEGQNEGLRVTYNDKQGQIPLADPISDISNKSAKSVNKTTTSTGEYFGSKKGKKYYSLFILKILQKQRLRAMHYQIRANKPLISSQRWGIFFIDF
jgi:hypothetical protein